VDLHNIIYPRSYSKSPQQQQAHPAFHQTQRIWILQSLNTLDSTISPYLMKTNPWLLVLDLFEFEAEPAKQSLSKAQYIVRAVNQKQHISTTLKFT